METDISEVQVQPGSATVRKTAMVLAPIKDASDRRPGVRGSVKNRHDGDVAHEEADQNVERASLDTALILKPISCKSESVKETQTRITQ